MAIIKYNKGNDKQTATQSTLGGSSAGVSMADIRRSFLPATPTDDEQNKYDVEKATRFLDSITLYDENEKEVKLQILNGNLYIDGNVVAKDDVVAYGTTTSELPTIKDYIEEQIVANPSGTYTAIAKTLKIGDTIYKIEGSGSGEGVMSWGGFGTSTGNGVANLTYDSATNMLNGTKATFLTQHQDISGKADKSEVMIIRGYINSNNTDLNTYQNIGIYGYDFNGKTIVNKPDDVYNWGTMVVTGYGSNNCVCQILIPDNSTQGLYVREGFKKTSGLEWHGWRILPTQYTVGNLISSAINALDVASVGGSGKFIQSISETDGKISATAGTFSKSTVGLGNVDNTSDASKPISTATQTALNTKLNTSAWNVGRTTAIDWDNITANGNYFVMNSATEHKPNADWYGQLLVLRADTTDTITQIYFPYSGVNVWVRSGNALKSGGSWNAWKALAYTTDITSAINALDVADSAETDKFVTSVSETDGKISVNRAYPWALGNGTKKVYFDNTNALWKFLNGNSSMSFGNDGSLSLSKIKLVSPDGTKTRIISVDNNGNLCVDGNIYADGGVTSKN